ncbi:Ig-like domain repeat protein [Streptomyces sp. JB150]|uniref:YncE family protein n=1 Tax=Streptomyces sp. JB150 TaxID=2714844 RepID=UPI00140B9CA3|nr:Ig-like domain repeat protein [Streptomyces sp. JB150]QIJ63746.1 Ig-like domain repeat protein [Streptomyces sp. JB150]
MRTRSISAATAFAVLLGSAALSVAVAAPASAATATVASPGGFVASDTLRRVFVGDSTAGRILAADYAGTVVDSVDGIGAVADLALSDDGTTLYASAAGSHEIVVLDAATLDVTARYAVRTTEGPRRLAVAGGKVWFGHGDPWDTRLGSVDLAADPAGGTDPVTLDQLPEGLTGFRDLLVDSDPSKPGVLAYAEVGSDTGSEMGVLDVSGATPRPLAYYGSKSYWAGDLDLVPGDAAEVLVNARKRFSYAGGQFTDAGDYPVAWQGDVSASGLVAQMYSDQVSVLRPNTVTPVRTYTVGGNGADVQVAWAPNASRLFALVQSNGTYTLKPLTDPVKSVPTLTVNAPATATRAKPLTVTGRLSASLPLPAGAQLKVTRTDLESPGGKALPAVTVKADGSYSFADTPPAGGTVTYKVAYAGDAEHTAATASDTVDVSRASTTLTLNNNGKVYGYGKDVTFTAHLGTTYKNRTVEIWANPYGSDKPNKLIKTATVNSSGNVSAVVDMKRDTVVSAVFKGDARYKPKTTKVTAYAKVHVSTAVSRHYKKAAIGSTTYYWFRKSTDPLLTTTMTYYPGRQQRFDLQVRFDGKWYDAGHEYFPVGSDGRSAVSLEAPGESGIKARMRSVYVNGSSGDNVNSTTYGSWKYLYFTN